MDFLVKRLNFLTRMRAKLYFARLENDRRSLAIPLLVGSAIVADEQRLGIADAQYCLPFSRHRIFAFKTLFALLVGGLLPAVCFQALESNQRLQSELAFLAIPDLGFSQVALIFVSITLAGILSSTLTKQTTQAFFIGICLIFVLSSAVAFAFNHRRFQIGDRILWEGPLAGYLMILAILITLPWLAGLNYRNPSGSHRQWRAILALPSIVVLPALLSAASYYRAWDYIVPPPAHGPARLTNDGAPKFECLEELLLQFPDGRAWRGIEDYREGRLSGRRFLPGVQWTKVVQCGSSIYALRRDGTLWTFRVFKGAYPIEPSDDSRWSADSPLVQFGTENNWADVLGGPWPYFLKTDGTLWQMRSRSPSTDRLIKLGNA